MKKIAKMWLGDRKGNLGDKIRCVGGQVGGERTECSYTRYSKKVSQKDIHFRSNGPTLYTELI